MLTEIFTLKPLQKHHAAHTKVTPCGTHQSYTMRQNRTFFLLSTHKDSYARRLLSRATQAAANNFLSSAALRLPSPKILLAALDSALRFAAVSFVEKRKKNGVLCSVVTYSEGSASGFAGGGVGGSTGLACFFLHSSSTWIALRRSNSCIPIE